MEVGGNIGDANSVTREGCLIPLTRNMFWLFLADPVTPAGELLGRCRIECEQVEGIDGRGPIDRSRNEVPAQRLHSRPLADRHLAAEETVENSRRLRSQRAQAFVRGDRLLMAAELFQHAGAIDERVNVARLERERALIACQCLLELAELRQRAAHIVAGIGKVGPLRQCPRIAAPPPAAPAPPPPPPSPPY